MAKYWPEFAENGKQDIEVRHLLSHTSGVSGWEPPFGIEDIYDREKATSHLARQPPWWPPGYHVVNYGHLIGEVIRRTTGKSLKQFVRDEIAESAEWRRADIGAANGHGHARVLARALSPISLGGKANGVQLLRPDTIDLIFEEQSSGMDVVLMIPLRYGIGFGLPCPESVPAIPDGKICFWGGWGGSIAVMDPGRGATITYVMNKMGPGTTGTERTIRYAELIYEALA